MEFASFGRIAGVLALTAGLAGCMDITMEIDVLNETTARATTTSVMGADFYAMAKAGMASSDDAEGFCEEDGAELTENADGSATCVMTVEGAFDDLNLDEGEDGVTFTAVSPGVVRVAFETADMKNEIGAGAEDEETQAMMQAFFEGHAITIRVRGADIIETNMSEVDNGRAAEQVIPFLDLLNGTVDLPEELFAVVRTN